VRRWSQILDTKRPVVTCPAFAGRRRGCCEVSSTAPPTTKKARAGRPGFFLQARMRTRISAKACPWTWSEGGYRICDQNARRQNGFSGGRLEQLRRIGLDRLDGFGRDLLGQFGELLAMAGESLELLLGVRGPQLQRL